MSDDLEARFAQLKQLAEAMGCDLNLSLTVGGININDLYRVRKIPNGAETLDGQLDEMMELVHDPRTQTAAKAARLMRGTELIAKDIGSLVDKRTKEYRVAIEAFQSISTDPPLDDKANEQAAELVTIARDETRLEMLMNLMDMLAKEKQKANGGTDATSPDDPGS